MVNKENRESDININYTAAQKKKSSDPVTRPTYR